MTNVDDERRWDAAHRRGVQAYPETHQQGAVQVHNLPQILEQIDQGQGEVDFGVQIAWDGRVWVCINGQAFLRFKPNGAGRQDGWAPWLVRFLRWITRPLEGH